MSEGRAQERQAKTEYCHQKGRDQDTGPRLQLLSPGRGNNDQPIPETPLIMGWVFSLEESPDNLSSPN